MIFILSDTEKDNSSRSIFITKSLRKMFVLLPALLWISIVSAQQPPKAVFLAPNQVGAQPFWTQAIEIMQAAAEDLKIELKIVYSKPSSYRQKKDGLAALTSRPPPDYLLSLYMIEATEPHLKLAEQSGIRSFIFNAGVVPDDREKIGRPRGKYRHWLGQLIPDDRQAGYLLADHLIDRAKAAGKTDKTGKVHLIGIGGFGVSIDESRENGLNKRINEQDDAVLDKTILTGWLRTVAYNETIKALEKFPEAGVIWCVSDATALAAIEAAKKLGRTPGQDIFIGGIDWNLNAIKAVASGEMTVTVGGHILEGARALILIHDYHHGIDFANEPGVEMQTPMKPITVDNAEEYLHRLNKLDWHKVDFRQFSKKYNPELKTYDLSLDVLLGTID